MIKHIILTYGAPHEHQRAIFSILSFWAWYKGDPSAVQTLVFTDRPDAFRPYLTGLPVEYRQLTTEMLEEMYGGQRFLHRAKIAVIEEIFKAYPTAKLLFCDSDTFFIANPEKLFRQLKSGVSIMHLREYRYGNAIPKGVSPEYKKQIQTGVDLITSKSFVIGNDRYRFNKTHYMYNSGVLGLSPEIAELLPDIYSITDTIHGNHKWLLGEQVAFSLVLSTKTRLRCSGRYVFHYWNQALKIRMDSLLNKLFNNGFDQLDLLDQLLRTKQLTTQWPGTVVVGMVWQKVLDDISEGKMIDAVKNSLRVTRDIFISPYKAAFAKKLLRTFKHRPRSLADF